MSQYQCTSLLRKGVLGLERTKEISGLPGKIVCLDLESGKLTDKQTVANVGSEKK